MEQQQLGLSITGVSEIMSTAPNILVKTSNSRDNAVKAADDLINAIEEFGMNDLVDANVSKYIDKAKSTIKKMKEQREPVTQIMDRVKKVFTGAESDIKLKIDTLQKHRNDYAQKFLEEKRRLEQKELARKRKEEEAIQIDLDITSKLNLSSLEFTSSEKFRLRSIVFLATINELDSLVLQKREFDLSNIELELSKFGYQWHTRDEIVSIYERMDTTKLFESMKHVYDSDVDSYIVELRDIIPSRRIELEKFEKANIEERERIEKARIDREEEERKRIKEDEDRKASDEKAKAEAKASEQKLNAITSGLFSQVAVTDRKVKETCRIEVVNRAGYGALFSFWFEKEGRNMGIDQFERMTIDRMKTFCEKHCDNTGEVIESEHLKYVSRVVAK